jgi:hypothetical protein
MKKFLIAGSSLAVAAAGSAGAVDVTLGGSIEMGWEYGVGKKTNAGNGFAINAAKEFQNIAMSVGVAGTTDAGLKYGGSFTMATADELAVNLYDSTPDASGGKKLIKLKNTSADQAIKAAAYNVSGGQQVLGGSIVSVKINSAWHEAKTSVTGLSVNVNSLAGDTAICKIGGKAAATNAAGADDVNVTRANAAGTKVASATKLGAIASGYMAAGRLADLPGGNIVTKLPAVSLTAATVNGVGNIDIFVDGGVVANVDAAGAVGGALDADLFDVALENGISPAADATDRDDYLQDGDVLVQNAAVYAGPFAEVKMTSSTTKMVVGAVCVTADIKASETKAYLDVASRIVNVSDASVYIEGGFGKLSLSTSKYKGSVAGIGGVGDAVEVGNTGLVATLSSVSFMGLQGSGAVDLGTVNLAQRPNYAFGTSVDLLGLTIAVEMEDEVGSTTDNPYIDKWDAATSYDLNGMSVAIATDSNRDWAMSAGYELMGFSMTSVVENVSKGASKKSGLSIDTTFATNLNGIGVSVALNEDLAWTIGASYSLGNSGLNMYVNYDSSKNGGKMGAKMSF